jgi:hypothetical protein
MKSFSNFKTDVSFVVVQKLEKLDILLCVVIVRDYETT